MSRVVVVDYGVGNLGSIPNMLRRAGADAIVTSDPAIVAQAERIILPGVGAFDAGMERLRTHGLLEPLTRRVLDDNVPTLGLCLGMQLLFESSAEGIEPGLGWLPGHVVRFSFAPGERLPVPHMGWSEIRIRRDVPLLRDLGSDPRFYFAHSYHAVPANDEDVVATTDYGGDLAVVVQRGSLAGAQFHPEKSHRFGLRFLSNFVAA